jgi:hypothetical protein
LNESTPHPERRDRSVRAWALPTARALLAAGRALAAAALLAVAPVPARAAGCVRDGGTPPPFRLGYDVQATRGMLAISGDNELRFERDGARYTLVSDTTAAPLYAARQSSRGTVGRHGLVPHEYAESRTRRPEAKVTFDWDAREVALGASGTRAPVQPRLQDRLSLLLEVGRLYQPGAQAPFEVPVAGVRRVEPYAFAPGAREALDVPAGRYDTVKMVHLGERLEIWIAPALCGLPVRVRYRDEHGLVIDNTLKSVELR